MNRNKQTKQNLQHLLYSSFGDGSQRHSPQHSYNEIEDGDQDFAINIPQQDKSWQSNDNIQFFKMEGPCAQLSQNFSQSSMLYSHRHDDDSRDYKNDSKNYKPILQDKKKEELEFNQVFQQQLNEIKKDKDRIQLQNSKLQTLNKDLENRVKQKQKNIELLQEEISSFEVQIQKLKAQNDQYLKAQMHRSSCLQEYKKQSEKILAQLAQKQKENNLLKADIAYLQSEIEKIQDYRNPYSSQPFDSSMNLKKNLSSDKQFDKIRKQKNSLQIELTALKDKLEDREARSKQLQEQNKKKIQLKQKRISQLQQRINQMKEQQMKLKTQNEVATQKLTNSINLKNKEILSLNQKINQSEKRIKSLFQETKRKDEKIKQISLQLLQKSKYITQNAKILQEMKVKLDFDHQMIDDKDKQIEKLMDQKKILKIQVENNQKIDKNDKADKNQKERAKRQMDKLKKELEATKKQLESTKKQIQELTKENQELQNAVKQNKKKFEQVLKKMQQMKNNNSQLEEETRKREQESAKQQQAYNKAMKQLNDYKKKNQSVAELKNKIILLQSRLKAQSERQTGQSFESTLQDRIELLQHKLQERDKENRGLKAKIRNEAQNSDYQLKELEEEIAVREQQIEELLKENEDLKREVAFKDQTLDFTHKILLSSERAKIQLQQQKKMLEEMVRGQGQDSFDGTSQQITKFYEEKLEQLQQMLKRKDEQHKFDIKQLKERIKELNDMLLNKQRRITPETMSPQDTVNFLIKTIKKVNRSADMLRVLSKNLQFKEAVARMDRQFRK